MNILVLLLAILAAVLADYLAYQHQTVIYIVLAVSATIVALALFLNNVGVYGNNGRTV